MTKKNLLVRLIYNDLIHLKLLHNLRLAGCEPHYDHYGNLSELIFELMGLDKNKDCEKLFGEYLFKSQQNTSLQEMEELSNKIYERLRVAQLNLSRDAEILNKRP